MWKNDYTYEKYSTSTPPEYVTADDLITINRALHSGRDVRIQRQTAGLRIVSDEIAVLIKRPYKKGRN